MNRIAIDTSNQALGLAVIRDGELVAELLTNIKKDHSSRLMPAIVSLMENIEMAPDDLDEIIVSVGPGSYTGTRIGITTAKTMAWALNIPIYPVSSLAALAYNGRFFNGYICPLFDARRETIFTSLYHVEHGNFTEMEPDCNISIHDWLEKLAEKEADILFLSPKIDILSPFMTEKLGERAIIPEAPFHLTKPANLLLLSDNVGSTEVHSVRPNYLRVTEAEANLKKQQKETN